LIVLIYYFIIIPVTTYIFLADRRRILFWFRNLFQENDRERIDRFIDNLNNSLSGFFRGQLIIVVLIGSLVGFLLWIFGIKYYLLLGIIAGLGNLIPNVGFILSLIPALLVGLVSTTPLASIIKICCVFFGEQLLENLFIGPLILGKHARLHPIIVMIALILGGAFMGFWGVVFAIPATILVRETLNHFLDLKL
jgi:predicted PurR-regulated permease PerM